jgi:hypothetical protein
VRQREGATHHCGDGEAIQDQRGGVVGQSLAFEDDDNPPRQMPGDRQRSDCVGRRNDGAQHEAQLPGEPHPVVRGGRDRGGGEYDTANCQQGDRPQVGFEFVPAHGHRGRVDDRRQHQEQHDFGRQLDVGDGGRQAQRHTAQHQQDGGRDFQADRNERNNRDDDQQADHELDGIQHRILLIFEAMGTEWLAIGPGCNY